MSQREKVKGERKLSPVSFTEQEAIAGLKTDDETGLSYPLNAASSKEWLQNQRCALQFVVVTKQH